MLTALADVTQVEKYYEEAWILSNKRYARAKRTLARLCYDRGDYHDCCQHMDEALAVQPLVPNAWYIKGIACMRLERWDDAVEAFTRCTQQDNENEYGEAWANIGAIHMRFKEFNKAYSSLTEAYKIKHDSWRIVENLMGVCLALGKWQETVIHMNTLLTLRNKSQRPVHKVSIITNVITIIIMINTNTYTIKDELRHICYIATTQAQIEFKKIINDNNNTTTDDNSNSIILEVTKLPLLASSIEDLLHKITNTIKSDADVWDIFGDFYRYYHHYYHHYCYYHYHYYYFY